MQLKVGMLLVGYEIAGVGLGSGGLVMVCCLGAGLGEIVVGMT